MPIDLITDAQKRFIENLLERVTWTEQSKQSTRLMIVGCSKQQASVIISYLLYLRGAEKIGLFLTDLGWQQTPT